MTPEPIIVPAGRTTHARSLAKTFSWRTIASIDTFILGWIVTGNWMFAGSIASLEVLTKIALYYFHERAWAHITWGVKASTPGETPDNKPVGH